MRNKQMKLRYYITLITATVISCNFLIAQKINEPKYGQNQTGWNNTLIKSKVFTRDGNRFLFWAISEIIPGKALDVGMGEGRNTLILARQGWDATGFDIADVAMDSARVRAEREDLKITTVFSSREDFDFGVEVWDLIAVIYNDIICGGCCAYDLEFIATLKRALKPGGRIVYEWFTREGLLEVQPAVKDQDSWGCRENTIRDAFLNAGGFEIVHYSEEPGIPDWDPSLRFEPVKLIYFIGQKQ
jgi:SAM-dependent methyltransferase